MKIDFDELKNSQFYKDYMTVFRRLKNYKETENFLSFDVLTIDHNFITRRKNQNLTLSSDLKVLSRTITAFPHINFFLDSPYMPETFKNLIIDQWMEVRKVVQTLSQSPIYSHLVIGGPGAYIDYHDHGRDCRQTVTFNYKFFEEKTESIEQSFVMVADKKMLMSEIKKSYFTFVDNPRHAAQFKEWNFLWIHDFYNYVEIDNIHDFDRAF